MFQVIWGDDEHTGADGTYVRVLKSRKWLYLTSAVAVLHGFNVINYLALASVLKGVVALSPWMATLSLLSGLIYLLVQYVALLVQLGSSYHSIIANRLPDSSVQTNAKMGIATARANLENVMRQLPGGENERAYRQQISEFEAHIAAYGDSLRQATRAQPTAQPLFRAPEYFIDWLRALLPLFVGLTALIKLARSMPGF